jgi:hypothetical protein
MKNLILGSVFSLLLFSVFGQLKISDDFSYTISKPYEVVDGSKSYFSKGDAVLSLKYGRGKFTFQKFEGGTLNETERNVVDKEEGFTVESYMDFNGRFFFFYSRWDRANTTEQLFVREIDFDKCNFLGKEQLLVKVNGKVTGGTTFDIRRDFFFSSGPGKFNFDSSFGEEFFIVQYRIKPEERNDALNKDVLGMHVFNQNLEKVWSKDAEMPYTEKKMNNLDFTVDSYGNAYILAEVYNDETTKRKTKAGDPNYRLEIIKITDDSEVSITKVELKNRFITDVGFFEGKNKEIVVAGYYGNKFNGGTDGVFYSKLGQSGDIEDQTSAEIPVEVMSMYQSERSQEKMEKRDDDGVDLAMSNMVLRELTFGNDGSVTLFGEKYFYTRTYNSQTKQYTYTSYYQEILVSKLDGEGSVAWMTKLPKNQRGSSNAGPRRGGMGYHLILKDGYDYVLFLDNIKNIELPMNKYPKTHSDGAGGFLTGFKIETSTGETEKVSLFDTRDAKGIELHQFSTGRIIALDENSFAIECYIKKKEDVMIKVTMK